MIIDWLAGEYAPFFVKKIFNEFFFLKIWKSFSGNTKLKNISAIIRHMNSGKQVWCLCDKNGSKCFGDYSPAYFSQIESLIKLLICSKNPGQDVHRKVDVLVAIQPTISDGRLAPVLAQKWGHTVIFWATPEEQTGEMISGNSLVIYYLALIVHAF